MSWKEDMISMMRAEGERNNHQGIQIATMLGPDSCKIGTLILTKQDLLFSDRLTKPTAVAVAGQCPADSALVDKSTYLPILQAGDLVAVYRMSDTKYLVLERMVAMA